MFVTPKQQQLTLLGEENKLASSLSAAARMKVFSLGRFQQCLGSITLRRKSRNYSGLSFMCVSEAVTMAIDVRDMYNPAKRSQALRLPNGAIAAFARR